MARLPALLFSTAGVALIAFSGTLSSLSDSAWWSATPWLLLALFWAGILALAWRDRRRRA